MSYATENFNLELRLRIAVEMIVHRSTYLDEEIISPEEQTEL